ncbi:MAG: hypothetical protein GC183_03825 [Thiobacillus sp.]|nr:hypothetical protein [Thiobacillus sp.]
MKPIIKSAVLGIALVLMFLVDVPSRSPSRVSTAYVQLVPEAQAIFGVWRRAARRTVIIGSAVVATTATAAAVSAQHQAAAANSAAASASAASASASAAAASAAAASAAKAGHAEAAAGKPLPLGTVVATLPAGCTSTPVGNVNYFYCGGNFYRAVFQGNNLVYVTAQP